MSQIRNAVLCALVPIFVVLVLGIGTRAGRQHFPVIASLAVVFCLLGLILVVLTSRLTESRWRKTLFLLAGGSAAGIPVSAVMHNLVYGLFIRWFGRGVWGPNGDEPVFFILAIFVFPALFVVSSAASVILIFKAGIPKNKNDDNGVRL